MHTWKTGQCPLGLQGQAQGHEQVSDGTVSVLIVIQLLLREYGQDVNVLYVQSFSVSHSTTQADMDKLKIRYLNDLAEGKVDHAQLQREQKQKEEELRRKHKSAGPGVH